MSRPIENQIRDVKTAIELYKQAGVKDSDDRMIDAVNELKRLLLKTKGKKS